MDLSSDVQATCVRVAGDWAIQIAMWRTQHPSKGERVIGRDELQKHFQKAYSFLIQTAEK